MTDRTANAIHPEDKLALDASQRRRAIPILILAIAAAGTFASGAVAGRFLWAPKASSGPVSVASERSDRQPEESPAQDLHSAHDAGSNRSAATAPSLDGLLAPVRAATSKYQDVSVAKSEGFQLVVRELPGMGAHFVQVPNSPSSTFEPTRPNMLLYRQANGRWELLAVGYILSKEAFPEPPEYFPGAHWHFHRALCIFSSGSVGILDEAECRSKSGFWVEDTGWMLHVWLYKENPSGVFSELNPTV